ncbi:MAG: phosphoadenylyl-sulfate reductase [Marinospirillum sp.]|uniref:phosphoadenylyl-sulfate reductase n=1 Tax=Marinospirillum sp. TaxID=2183934 RepID=UPI0019DAEBD0|nr:phosphoadenylyl-sulfate reductase [Marinospirillum sp.]MBE0506076.1 phosphoadenylyl-sulfate reductase [Marinospirillum sp.]
MSLDAFLEPDAGDLLDGVTDAALKQKLLAVVERLQQAAAEYGEGLTFANSLGAEDALLTGLIAEYQPDIQQFVLDTGRLPEETLTLLDRVRQKWPQLRLQAYYPDAAALQSWVTEQGVNAFYRSQELRKACCGVRKLEPLKRALAGRAAWITGLRREQSVTRDQLQYSERDEANGLQKISPLFDWSEAEVWEAIHALKLPYNRLHDQDYPSIGCAPCTRAVNPGDDPRSGRWWWENPETRECGLHQR